MDVSAGEVMDLIREGVTHVEEIKRQTSCGMGPCQGHPCWELLRGLLALEGIKGGDRPSHRPPRAGPVTIEHPDVVRLYLQESRAPAAGARAPIRALADDIRNRAIDLTEFAVDHRHLRIRDPRVSALAVIGAVEQLAFTVLSGELDSPPDQIAGTLISLVLQGIRG